MRSRGLAAIVVACPLVWALASVAEARPKSPPRAQHVAVAETALQGDHAFVDESVPREPRGVEPAAEEALQVTLTFVDHAGGHARVLPIETANPYRAR